MPLKIKLWNINLSLHSKCKKNEDDADKMFHTMEISVAGEGLRFSV